MCYACKPVALPGIRIAEGFRYAKDDVPVLLEDGEMRLMRWDLIPRSFLRLENVTRAEAIQKKNSRAVNPATGKTWGFSSYNARIETVETLWAFKEAWREGRRGVIPIEAFRERPNMEGAPEESKGREYEIALDQTYFLAALFDTWTAKNGESLESCTVITGPSDGIPALQGIWHERVPILLSEEARDAWLDPATTPQAALALLRAAPVPALTVTEVPKPEKSKREKTKPEKPERPTPDAGQVALDL
jgi:putative SOS response-associated peptidase YedK